MSGRRTATAALLAGLLASALDAAPTANGRIVYSINTTTPQHRAYTASSNTFSAAAAMQLGVAQRWMVDRAAPARNEHLAGYVTTTGVLYIQRWNGTAWSAEWNVTVGGNGVDGRRFDIAYENTTGDAMVVYSTNATGTTGNELAWRKWNGASWTAAATLNSARFNQAAAVTWIKLKARPTAASNEIALLAADTGTTTANTSILSSYIWSGSAWTEAATSHTGSAGATLPNTTGQLMQNECFDQAYESTSGDLLVAFTTASTAQQWYRTYSGGTWAAATSYGTARAAPLQMIAESDPLSNQILVMWNRSASAEVYARVWTGAAQGTLTTIGANGVTTAANRKQIAAHWLNVGGTAYAVALWQTNVATPNQGTKGYNSFNGSTTTWGTAATFNPAVDSVAQWMDSDADPQGTDTLMLTYGDAASDVWAKRLVLSAGPTFTWTNADGGTALTTALGSITSQNFSFAYDRNASVVVATLTSPTATLITNTTATLGANITSNGGAALTARGTCWGTTAAPATNCLADGNTTTGLFTQARTALTAGTLLYYRGYATNSAGTGYSPDGSFYTEPTTQASAVTFTAVAATSMTVNWTRGSGSGVIVLMKSGSAVNSDPVDGTYTGYTANAAFASGTQIGTGNYIVYKGTGTSVPVTALAASTTYHVAVYEYAGTVDTVGVNQGTNYKLTPAIGNQATSAITPPTLSSPTATAITNTTATLGANVTSNGGATLTARGTCWGLTVAPVTNCLSEGGTGIGVFTQARTGLTAATRLFYRGYATNSAGTRYSPDGSFYTEPTTQASAVTFTAITTTTMTVNWTRGSGSGVLVLMKQGVAVDADPVDGTYTGYTASAAFGGGTQLGTGNYVLYKGTGTSVPVTGLSASMTYHLAVYEYAGTIDTVGVDQGTNFKLTPARGSQATPGDNRTTPGTPAAAVGGCTQISVAAPFSGDANSNSTTTVSRGPSGTGPWTAACTGLVGASPRSCVDNGALASSTYYYQVDFADVDGVLGTDPQVIGPFVTPPCAENRTTPGSASMIVSGCRQITVTAPFTGDGDGDGAVLVEYSPTNTWPGTSACGAVGGPSPRMCLITGLTPSSVYFARVTYSDPDGLLGGTNPQLLGSVTTTACTGNGAPPMILPLAPSAKAVVGGVERFRVQVYDPDGVTAVNVLWAIDGATLANTGVTQSTTFSCNIDSQTACKIFEFDVNTSAFANGSHYVTVQATDSAAAPAAVGRRGWGFVVNNSGATAAGSGELLRRTHGSQSCVDCHNLATHSSQSTSFNYGAWAQECLTCHTPHATKNIYLVREAIETPNSGAKPVDFRNLSGKADFSFATVTAPGNGACEVCHTKTKNSDGTPRFRNSGGSDGGKHYSTSCIACHGHRKGFAAGESEGLATCAGCHADIWNGMNGTVAKTSKHTLGTLLGTNDAFTDTALTWGSPLSGNAAASRSCVNMCHNDHPHSLTSPVTATHENNVYMDATSQTSRAATTRTSADKDKTDFEAAQTNGGMCVSCHRNPVVVGRPAISKAAFDASAHDYTTFSTYGAWTYTQHDGGVFNRNCTKCHAGRNDARPAESAIFFEAVHFSDYPSLLAGSTNPNSTPATFVCYNCHGNGTTGVNLSGKAIATQVAKTRNHPSNSDNVHNSVTELGTAAFGNTLGVTGRHANCLDCHDTHAAKAGTAASPGNLAGPPLEGAWGARLSTNPAFWSDTTAASFTKQTLVAGAGLEATLCFKCHTRYYWGTTATTGRGVPPAAPSGGTYVTGTAAFTNGSATVTGTGTTWSATSHLGWVIRNNANGTWHLVTAVGGGTSLTISPAASFTAATSAYTLQMAETDVAKEFNPANVGNFAGAWAANETAGGFHPILANAGSNLGRVATANLTTTGGVTWGAAGTNLMSCTDCHESETTTDPNGPHGSTASFILRGPNTTWSATVVQGTAGMPAGTFCINCHAQNFASSRFATHFSRSDHRVACWNCHAAVPHGGPRPGMLVAPAGGAAGVGGTITGWDTTAPYWGLGTSTAKLYIASYPANNTTGWGQSNCGCNGTGH